MSGRKATSLLLIDLQNACHRTSCLAVATFDHVRHRNFATENLAVIYDAHAGQTIGRRSPRKYTFPAKGKCRFIVHPRIRPNLYNTVTNKLAPMPNATTSLLQTLTSPIRAMRKIATSCRSRTANMIMANLTEALADDPVIKLPAFQGVFSCPANSDLFRRVVKTGSYEHNLSQCAVHYAPKDRDAIDVGANCGIFTVLLAKLLPTGRVLSLEPTPIPLQHLNKNLRQNGVCDRVIVFEGVADAVAGQTQLNYIEGREEFSSLGPLTHKSVRSQASTPLNVTAATVDSLVAQHSLTPGFIKIDAEGAEHKVLSGMASTIQKHRPVILLELSPELLLANGASAEKLMGLLKHHRYRLLDANCLTAGVTISKTTDILAVPSLSNS